MLEQNKTIAIFEIAIMKNLAIFLGYSYYFSGFNKVARKLNCKSGNKLKY